MESITENEILEALREAFNAQPEGHRGALTVGEIVERTGQSVANTRKHIRRLIGAGTMECVRKPHTDIAGRATVVPAYRVVP